MKKQYFLLLITFFISSTSWATEFSPINVEGSTTISVAEAKALFDSEVLFVDVRKDSDWDAGRVPGAIHLNNKSGEFTEAALSSEISKDEKVVIYCNGPKCMRSSKGCKQAVDWGFSKVYYFRDGIPAWKSAGYPME